MFSVAVAGGDSTDIISATVRRSTSSVTEKVDIVLALTDSVHDTICSDSKDAVKAFQISMVDP